MKKRLASAAASVAAPFRERGRSLLLALALAALLALALYLRSQHSGPSGPAASATPAPQSTGPQLPDVASEQAETGLLALDDFRIVVPTDWQRRKDMENEGPGTKLFLVGPQVGTSNLVIGIDVYPLRAGTTLEQFVKQYSAKWNLAMLTNRPATLCEKPARLLALSQYGLDRVYLITVWRDKGFAVGMFGPAGHSTKTTQAFRRVLDTFQLYE